MSLPKKPRKRETVINDLAQAMAKAYAASEEAWALENKVQNLKYELSNIVKQEVNK